ncbi:N-acetyl-gamma-glutamyl-phosphate reductase [Legionella beliardensis]|uniref:N-acetyl-gamma-glutamyl-phosphate reductase n=1 Tax=Legionella beliardensis TaxID=91822 RepID=A0A378I293_9GAMM|nr:N-acetyl-gamma-glutamyl-phosphate reductase [Legionella beliardensis]STX28850.1 N-acetyl-gamma-glutamyl-phosphate reductase [Legionella beliardensis]
MNKQYKVAIVGIQGYIGQELTRLVTNHPYLQLVAGYSRQAKEELYQQIPALAGQEISIYSPDKLKNHASQLDIIFLATPAEASMELTTQVIYQGSIIIDLSGAFRLPQAQFTSWYAMAHTAPELIKYACYGLSPWVTSQAQYTLIANPGCYAACALMTLLPLLKADLLQLNQIIIDAKSGVSGSGKQINPDLMFCELANNFFPYKIGKHQHTPEINKALSDLSHREVNVRLTTSMLPLTRGLAMTIYAQAKSSCSDDSLSFAIETAFKQAYQAYPLVRYQEVGKAGNPFILALKHVINTPYCHIGYFVKEGQITLFSTIDNLLKGAASQAIENVNAFYKLPLHTGLLSFKGAL